MAPHQPPSRMARAGGEQTPERLPRRAISKGGGGTGRASRVLKGSVLKPEDTLNVLLPPMEELRQGETGAADELLESSPFPSTPPPVRAGSAGRRIATPGAPLRPTKVARRRAVESDSDGLLLRRASLLRQLNEAARTVVLSVSNS